VCYNSSSSCCARVKEVSPTYLLLQRRESSWKQTGERDARRRPIEELTNAIESEKAAEEEQQQQEDGDQLHTKRYEELEEPLPQTEREALATMYLELEKERNASTTAANEAMGMIAHL
jgi:hypothetical protein